VSFTCLSVPYLDAPIRGSGYDFGGIELQARHVAGMLFVALDALPCSQIQGLDLASFGPDHDDTLLELQAPHRASPMFEGDFDRVWLSDIKQLE